MDEYTEEQEQRKAEQFERLEKLGIALAKSRSEAIDGRESSGIEEIWKEDEEFYEGIDDANRGESDAWRSKPAFQATPGQNQPKSTVFFNITRPYVDAASARIGDMLLPTDDKGWAIGPTPIPQLSEIAKGNLPEEMVGQIQADPRLPDDAAKQAQMGEITKSADEMVTRAKEAAEKAEKRIEDWHVECQYNAEMRQVIEDSAKIGTGVMKGPIPSKQQGVKYTEGALEFYEKTQPKSQRVDAWNCFPDKGCGNNIHKGAYHWERDYITERELNNLIGVPGYIEEQIELCIDEEPHKAVKSFSGDHESMKGLVKRDKTNLYEIWYYYGRLSKEDMECCGLEAKEGETPAKIDACVTMVNNRVIKAAKNYMESGEFPYDYMPWQRRTDSPFGIGVARQINTPQRVVNGAARNLMTNAGLAGGPMWIYLQGLVEPVDGIWEIAPLKGWQASEDADLDDARKAFTFIDMPMMQSDLQAIIQLGLKMAEDVTGLPMLLQGQQGNAPDTLGGTEIVNNNASTVLRRIARLWDDYVTEPHIRRYYRYLLQYGEHDDEKGDFVIEARGSSALIERDVQNQFIAQMANIAANPIFGLDPKKWAKEHLKSQRLDPAQFEFDDEQWEQIVSNMMSGQEQDTSTQVAEIRAAVDQERIQSNEAIKAAELEYKRDKDERDREVLMIVKDAESQLKEMQGQDKKEIDFSKIKAQLAEVASKLRVQKELSGTQAITPPVEPKGRAPDGQSFER